MVAHAFIPNTKDSRRRHIFEFEANLVYIASSTTARATLKTLVLKNKTEKYSLSMFRN